MLLNLTPACQQWVRVQTCDDPPLALEFAEEPGASSADAVTLVRLDGPLSPKFDGTAFYELREARGPAFAWLRLTDASEASTKPAVLVEHESLPGLAPGGSWHESLGWPLLVIEAWRVVEPALAAFDLLIRAWGEQHGLQLPRRASHVLAETRVRDWAAKRGLPAPDRHRRLRTGMII
jgi:hypothetical protein